MTTLLAYHGDRNLKAQMVHLAKAHREADELVQGFGYGELDGNAFRGCAVGCTLESYRRIKKLPSIEYRGHAQYPAYLGVPIQLAYIEDRLFENLPKKNAQAWPTQFLDAIRPGANLSMVWPAFLRDLLANPKGGVQKLAAQRTGERGDEIRASISAVVALFDRWLNTGVKPQLEKWQEARFYATAFTAADAAYATAFTAADAADAAAYAAADAAAYAAYATAFTAADAADAAAYADADDAAAYAAAYADAAVAAAADAAKKCEYVRQSKVILKLLKSAPVRKVKRG